MPCQDEYQEAVNPKTSFFYAELAREQRQCYHRDPVAQNLPTPSGFDLTEHEFQLENGVLHSLQKQVHYTYSFFPDDNVKKDIPLYIYQRPTFHWKLECENGGQNTVNAALDELQLVID